MSEADVQLHGICDPRLAVHATSAMPVWFWSLDGARILWANAVGARLFGAANAAVLAERTIGAADPHRRQAAQLAMRLSPSSSARLERLRGFGAPLGRLLTCACARLTFADGTGGLLIAAVESAGRPMPLTERLASLVDSISTPAIIFTPNGALAGVNEPAKHFAALFSDLTGPGFDEARSGALRDGRSMLKMDIGRVSVHRVGSGDATALVALIGAKAVPKPTPKPAAEVILPEADTGPTVEHVAHAMEAETVQAAATETSANVPQDHAPHEQSAEPSTDVTPVDGFESAFDETRQDISSTLLQMDSTRSPEPQHPLRFIWQMDEDGRFSLGSDEFSRLIGTRTAAAFGRPWSEISGALGLDPEGHVAAAVATRGTWSGIVVNWPADGAGARLPVELSGLPITDRAGHFSGYRGFGVCRDIEGMARLAAQRHDDVLFGSAPPVTAPPEDLAAQNEPTMQDNLRDVVQDNRLDSMDQPPPAVSTPPETTFAAGTEPENFPKDIPSNTEPNPPVDIPQNVVPFPGAEPKSPALTPVESSAFDELARRLSARLDGEIANEAAADETASTDAPATDTAIPESEPPSRMETEYPATFAPREPVPPRATSAQDAQLLDRVPVGVLIYRLDRLLYANSAFLASTGYDSLHALAEAGGLDALTVESGAGAASSTSETGTPVVIAATSESGPDKGQPADARLFAITWDGEPAHALVFSGPRLEPRHEPRIEAAAAIAPAAVQTEDTTQAEELATILDTTAEGVLIFDAQGKLISCNRSAEALFGRNDTEIAALNLADLFAPESQRAALDYLENVKAAAVASLLDHGRETMGRMRDGSIIPLSITIDRTRPGSERFFAIFRDLSPTKQTEGELMQARRQAERATTAKADILARISHEVRMPLNAIIGFSDVMIDERFGALGNERYVEYMKDIRASGQRVMAIIDDLLDLTRIESGKMEMSFASQDLNNMVEQCVAVMQPQANRERIIIRTSLAHSLPTVKADARALRQIALNLIGNSIHLANAGGQVIVSTATTDFGDIVLRVRDTGPGLNDNEIAAAMAPFRTPGASDQTADGSVVNLSLTKALVEANRAQFHIKTAPHSGTLIEVVFSHASAIA
jgi:PAS domain S-box-containing protein